MGLFTVLLRLQLRRRLMRLIDDSFRGWKGIGLDAYAESLNFRLNL